MKRRMKKIRCPKCGSEEVSEPRYSPKAFAISMLLVGIPLFLFGKTACHCFRCGEDFSIKKVR
jgi:DNA-directed RNA polymerase subunit RPC12/RpoP